MITDRDSGEERERERERMSSQRAISVPLPSCKRTTHSVNIIRRGIVVNIDEMRSDRCISRDRTGVRRAIVKRKQHYLGFLKGEYCFSLVYRSPSISLPIIRVAFDLTFCRNAATNANHQYKLSSREGFLVVSRRRTKLVIQ